MKSIASLVVIALAAAACSSTEVKQAEQAPATSVAPAPVAATNAATPTNAVSKASNPLNDPNNILSQRSVFFDFDSSVVGGDYQKLLQAQSTYLAQNGGVKIRIEGNCDERGSREYNLALGQRRAQSVKNVMTVLGVDDSRAEAISYGEDKPANLGHDEASWAKNRHADIKYPGE